MSVFQKDWWLSERPLLKRWTLRVKNAIETPLLAVGTSWAIGSLLFNSTSSSVRNLGIAVIAVGTVFALLAPAPRGRATAASIAAFSIRSVIALALIWALASSWGESERASLREQSKLAAAVAENNRLVNFLSLQVNDLAGELPQPAETPSSQAKCSP